MVGTIITQIKNYLTDLGEGLTWAERVAGLVSRAERPIMMEVEGRQVQFGVDAFPISHDVEGKKCWETGKYYALLPSHTYKSVIYFEQTSPLVFAGPKDIKGKIWVFTGNIRLVCWINAKKFGVDTPGLSDRLMLMVLKRMVRDRPNKGHTLANSSIIPFIDDNFINPHLEVLILGQPVTDSSIFGRYTIGAQAENLLFPYEYFAIDMQFRFEVGKECIIDVYEADPIC